MPFLPAVLLICFLTRDKKAASEETAQDPRKTPFSVGKLLLWTAIAGVGVGMFMRDPVVVSDLLILSGLSLVITVPTAGIVVMILLFCVRNSDADVDSKQAGTDKQKARWLAIGIMLLLIVGLTLSLETILVELNLIGA